MIEEEISVFSQKGSVEKNLVPKSVQESINGIVKVSSTEVKTDTKEMFKGVLLGGTIGVIICLHRQKNIWIGVLAGGLIGMYVSKSGILKIEEEKE